MTSQIQDRLVSVDSSDDEPTTTPIDEEEFGNGSHSQNPLQQRKIGKFHEEVISRIDKGELSLAIKDDIRNAYLEEKRKYFLANGPKSTSLLHLLVEPDSEDLKDFEIRKPFIELLLDLDSELPIRQDAYGQTPLRRNIDHNVLAKEIVTYLCSISSDAVQALGIPSTDASNCLHAAIEKGIEFPEDVVQRLPKNCLTAKNMDQETPLHLAVKPPCKKSWVESLIKYSAAAIQEENKVRLQPLRYYMRLREDEARGKKQKEKPKSALAQRSKKAKVPGEATPKGDGKIEINDIRKSEVQAFLKIPVGNVTENSLKEGRVNNQQETINGEVESFLRLHCLRNLDREMAIKLLYEPDKKREVEFDLELRTRISDTELNDMAHVKLDSILQYVHIPTLEVDWKESDASKKLLELKACECPGRMDYCVVFDWLRARGVKKILKVIVDDTKLTPHSDQAIEYALNSLGVETWDWKKEDISSEVIYNAAGDTVREVNLHCSGNNAVLRGWADSGGLIRLGKLETVKLHVNQGLESRSTMEKYVKDFKDQLGNECSRQRKDAGTAPREINVISNVLPSTKAGDSSSDNLADKQDELGVQERKWLLCMDKFADFIRDFEGEIEEQARRAAKRKAKSQGQDAQGAVVQDPMPPPRAKPQIKVALIDDGVYTGYERLNLSIEDGESFCKRPNPKGLHSSYYQSSGGHGTVMASLIRRICRNVRLYVAKLDVQNLANSQRSFSPESAAEAIRWAIGKDVDIISMSWTIDVTSADDKNAGISALKKAVEEAISRNILLFCATRDQGVDIKDRTYPRQFNPTSIVSIGAATLEGESWKYTGDDTVDFILPGEGLIFQTDQYQTRLPEKWETHSGSSLSTALASGLAALILYCAQTVDHEKNEKLKTPQGMKNSFEAIGKSDSKYVLVWDVFEKYIKEAPMDQDKKKTLMIVVNRLLRWSN